MKENQLIFQLPECFKVIIIYYSDPSHNMSISMKKYSSCTYDDLSSVCVMF